MISAPRPLILDFGMHQGEDSAFYLASGAEVVAFEANPDLVAANRVRFAAEIAAGQLTVVAGAVVGPECEADSIRFYVNKAKSVWGTTSEEWVARAGQLGTGVEAIDVPTVRLDAVLEGLRDRRVLYAKIDIEGADRVVLEALGRARMLPQYCSIESDKTSLEAVAEEIAFLRQLGYKRFAAVQQATVPGGTVSGQRLDERGGFLHRFEKHASGPFGPFLPQEMTSADQVLADYAGVFRRYRMFGDNSMLMRNPVTRFATRAGNAAMIRLAQRPLCGWYDTHAAL